MRRLLAALVTVLALLLVGVIVAPFVLPADWIRDRLVAAAEAATGLRIGLEGPVSLSVFPEIALDASDVSIARPDRPDLAKVGRARVSLALRPLLDGRVEVTGLTLERPVITLAVASDGSGNWADPAATATGAGSPGGVAVSVSHLTVTDGTVSFDDARTGRKERVTGLDVETALADLDAPLEAEGRLTTRGVTTGFNLALESPARLMSAEKADASLTLTIGDASATARGALALTGDTLFTGTLSAVAPDLRATAAALALPPPVAGSLRVDARLAAGPTRVDATELTLVADETTATGEMGVDVGGPRPRIDARLAVDAVDLDRIAARRPAAGNGRDDDPAIDPALLALADGGVDIKVGRITGSAFDRLGAIEGLHVVAVAQDGAADVQLNGMRLAGGSLTLRTKAKPDGKRLRIDGSLKADGFEIAALAALARASVPVDGRLGADIRFAAAGRSVSALSETLDAAGSIGLTDGTVTGLGLAGAFGDPAADRVDRIALKASFGSLADPLRFEGDGRFGGRPVAFSATVDPRRVLDGHAFPLTAEVATGGVTARFDGDVMTAQSAVTGRASVAAESLAALAAVAGRPASGLPAGAFRATADVETSARSVSVDNLKVKLGDGGFSGAVTVNLGDRPRISARFDGPVVDLGGLIAGAAAGGADPGTPAPSRGSSWSDAPLDLTGFRAFDADVRIGAGGLRYGALTTGRAEAAIRLDRGKLALDIPKAALFGGSVEGALTLDGAADVPAARVRLRIDGADVAPVLAATVGTGRITGRTDVAADLATSGGSVRALIGAFRATCRSRFATAR